MTYRLLVTAYQVPAAGPAAAVSTQVVPYDSAPQARAALFDLRDQIDARGMGSVLRFNVLALDPGIELPQA